MIVLGIETSCDDTGIAILEIKKQKFKILANLVSSQVKLHAKYGGVWPYLAKREHKKNLPIVFKKALKKAKNPKIDLISVTIGPGLEPCLWEGINFAKKLAKKLKIPLVGINHLEAHLLINFLKLKEKNIFPAIGLIVSGGHTQLILMEKFLKYKLLGETRDDAAGECLDKVARLLGLSYPGGPKIEKLASKCKTKKHKISLPRPMIDQKNYDFSFAGLKTAVLYDLRKRKEKEKKLLSFKREMAKEVQQAIIDVLLSKTSRAAKDFKAKSIFLGGGVIANKELKKQFLKNWQKPIFIPKKEYCTDNGLMVALAGYFHHKEATKEYEKIEAKANLRI